MKEGDPAERQQAGEQHSEEAGEALLWSGPSPCLGSSLTLALLQGQSPQRLWGKSCAVA